MVQTHKNDKIPDRSVAITFDDGYAEIFHSAKPLHKKYSFPATIFVASGHIGSERESSWDGLERIILQPSTLPETLALGINGKTFKWDLGEATEYSRYSYQRDSSWIIN